MNSGSRRDKVIVMLGVHPESKERGGISTVVDIYRDGGLFKRWPISYIGTMASGSHAHKIVVFLRALGAYLRVVLSGRAALVHAHTASRASFWRKSVFMLIARVMRIPVILHLHGAEFEQFYDRESGALRRGFIRFVLAGVDRVVVLSSQWQTVMRRIAPAAHTMVIANPIALPAIAAGAEDRRESSLLFLGRFGQRKGIFDLLNACAIVRHQFPSLTLRCGGDGDAVGVTARIRELGLESCVVMLGWVSGEAKERELSQAALYVLPSYAEGLPMGVLEAMAAGTPPIATTVGGIPDAIEDGINGFLIEPGDVTTLAQRITQLLSDAQLRARFAAAARAKVISTFATERVLTQLEDLYAKLGAQPRPMRLTHAPSESNPHELDLSVGDR